MKKYFPLISFITVILLLSISAAYYFKTNQKPTIEDTPGPNEYTNRDIGISFKYPDTVSLRKLELPEDDFQIVLNKKDKQDHISIRAVSGTNTEDNSVFLDIININNCLASGPSGESYCDSKDLKGNDVLSVEPYTNPNGVNGKVFYVEFISKGDPSIDRPYGPFYFMNLKENNKSDFSGVLIGPALFVLYSEDYPNYADEIKEIADSFRVF